MAVVDSYAGELDKVCLITGYHCHLHCYRKLKDSYHYIILRCVDSEIAAGCICVDGRTGVGVLE